MLYHAHDAGARESCRALSMEMTMMQDNQNYNDIDHVISPSKWRGGKFSSRRRRRRLKRFLLPVLALSLFLTVMAIVLILDDDDGTGAGGGKTGKRKMANAKKKEASSSSSSTSLYSKADVLFTANVKSSRDMVVRNNEAPTTSTPTTEGAGMMASNDMVGDDDDVDNDRGGDGGGRKSRHREGDVLYEEYKRPRTNWLWSIARGILNAVPMSSSGNDGIGDAYDNRGGGGIGGGIIPNYELEDNEGRGSESSSSYYRIPDEINEPLSKLFAPIDSTSSSSSSLPTYSLSDVVNTVPRFHTNVALLVYDPRGDAFVMHYPEGMRWVKGCKKLLKSFEILANSLRIMFPDRFDPRAYANDGDARMTTTTTGRDGATGTNAIVPELAMAVSSGDYPSLNWNECMLRGGSGRDCDESGSSLSPILHFGSVFRTSVLPTTMLPMPMPQWNHLHCFHYWTLHRRVCNSYLPRGPDNPDGMVSANILPHRYDDLIPQVVWRGTDFSYLENYHPDLRRPDFNSDVVDRIGGVESSSSRVSASTRSDAVDAMRDVYDELVPRWKGVVWTAEAERDAERYSDASNHRTGDIELPKARMYVKDGTALPWCNIKFAMYAGKKTLPIVVKYRRFVEYGIPAAGEAMSIDTLATYKYHIDIGGGGGTTWSGTLEKLGLPGVLFHHVTPTMDYIHDLLTPWVHYIPVEADLRDLREKYEWAEANPRHAERISAAATALVVSLGTPDGFGAMHRRFYEEPLRRVMESYRPLADDGIDWRESLPGMGGGGMTPIYQCGGYYHHDCERLVDKEFFNTKRAG